MEEDEEFSSPDDAVDIDLEDEPDIETQVDQYVFERYQRAKDARLSDEERWLKAYRNYRGTYMPEDVEGFDNKRSTVFIKITKTKVLAASSQINEVLFGNQKFPISVEPTTLPEGVSDTVHFNPNQPPMSGGPEQEQSQSLLPGETHQEKMIRLGGMEQKLAPIRGELQAGPGTTPESITFHPAMVAAKKMEKKIHDQLEECDATKELRYGAFECALFGTMVFKGPFGTNKEYPNWDIEGEYDPVFKFVPEMKQVSIWDIYPDSDGRNVKDCEYIVERHKFSKSQMRDLKRKPFFSAYCIEEALEGGEDYLNEWWEGEITDKNQEPRIERYEVLEYWGFIDRDLIEEFGIKIPKELEALEQLSANIWTCNGKVLRMILNPFKPAYLPYYAVPYEINPYSFFGIGVGENMEDTQDLMNVFMRMGVDNAALSGNLVFEVDEDALAPGQNLEFYPGKVIRRQSGAPGTALFSHQFQNVTAQNMQMFDVARRLSDEATGMPSFAHGQTGVTGVGRTASGISMLMSAANGNIRQVVHNIDDFLLAPLGQAFFRFNMQFDFDPEIRGDLEIKARGTESLMADEVRSQRLMQFLQVVGSNPATMPFAKIDYIISEIAASMDLDPEKVTNSLPDAALQAKILSQFAAMMQPPTAGGPMNPADTQGSGGGTMGTGTAPVPGEQGFSANTGAV